MSYSTIDLPDVDFGDFCITELTRCEGGEPASPGSEETFFFRYWMTVKHKRTGQKVRLYFGGKETHQRLSSSEVGPATFSDLDTNVVLDGCEKD